MLNASEICVSKHIMVYVNNYMIPENQELLGNKIWFLPDFFLQNSVKTQGFK